MLKNLQATKKMQKISFCLGTKCRENQGTSQASWNSGNDISAANRQPGNDSVFHYCPRGGNCYVIVHFRSLNNRSSDA